MNEQYLTEEERSQVSKLFELFTKIPEKKQDYVMGYMQCASEENINGSTNRTN